MSADVNMRVFVVGVPRSGTTLLQSLLAAHSRVASFTESHFFSRHFRAGPLGASAFLLRDPSARVGEFLRENGLEGALAEALLEEAGWVDLGSGPLVFQTRAVAEGLLGVLDALARSQQKPVWVEKTPRHLRFVPYLQGFFDGPAQVRFVHMMREGAETAASLYLASRHWERTYDLRSCAERWNRDVAFSLGRLASRHDHFVFYEDVARDTESTLRELLGALGLEWEPSILQNYRSASRQVIAAGERWKHGVGDAMRHSTASLQALSDVERRELDRRLDPELYAEFYRQVSERRSNRADG